MRKESEAHLGVEVSERVMDMVRRELVENPEVGNAVLFEKASKLDPDAMADVDRRQFNARYPLQVKRRELGIKPKSAGAKRVSRRRARSADGGKPVPAPAGPQSVMRLLAREGVRDVLLRFAQDLANSESRGELVSVVASVDGYVDQILGMGSFPE